MRQSIIALGAFITAASIFGAAPARADYPFCRSSGGDSYSMRCDFNTFEQCQATASGIGGTCIQNPYNPGPNASYPYTPNNANARYRGPARRIR
jgi:hypothetical protein